MCGEEAHDNATSQLNAVIRAWDSLWKDSQQKLAKLCPGFRQILDANTSRQAERITDCDPRLAILQAVEDFVPLRSQALLNDMARAANEVGSAFFYAEHAIVSAMSLVFDGLDELAPRAGTPDEELDDRAQALVAKFSWLHGKAKGAEFLAVQVCQFITLAHVQLLGAYDRMAQVIGYVARDNSPGKADYADVLKRVSEDQVCGPLIDGCPDWAILDAAREDTAELERRRNVLVHRATLSQKAFAYGVVENVIQTARQLVEMPVDQHIEFLAAHLGKAIETGMCLSRFMKRASTMKWRYSSRRRGAQS